MKVIGRGWQYTTYDIGNARVLKKFNTRFTAYLMMLHDSFPYVRHPFWKFHKYYKRCRQEAAGSIQKILHTTLEGRVLGNPRVLNELDYEQDKVTPLRRCLKSATLEEAKKIIDAFVEFNKTLIGHSLIDRNFLITDNFATSADGNIILVDLGELYSDPKVIRDHIAKRPWTVPDVLNSLPKNFRNYFVEKMDFAFITHQ
jgi:hypothetical protein